MPPAPPSERNSASFWIVRYLISLSQLVQFHDLCFLFVHSISDQAQIVLELVVVNVPGIVSKLLDQFQVQDPLVLMFELSVGVFEGLVPDGLSLWQLFRGRRCYP